MISLLYLQQTRSKIPKYSYGFTGQITEESSLSYRRSVQVTRLYHDYSGTLSLPLSLIPIFFLSVDHLVLGNTLPFHLLLFSSWGKNWGPDGWMKGGIKIGVGKINSRVSSDSSWVSFISIRLTKSLSTTGKHVESANRFFVGVFFALHQRSISSILHHHGSLHPNETELRKYN